MHRRGGGQKYYNKFQKFGSKLTLIIASPASSDMHASSHGSGMFLGPSTPENNICWVANGGSRLVLKDQVLWERAHWQRLGGEAGGEGCGHRGPVPLAPRQSRSGSKMLLSARSAPRYTWSGDVRKAGLGCLANIRTRQKPAVSCPSPCPGAWQPHRGLLVRARSGRLGCLANLSAPGCWG